MNLFEAKRIAERNGYKVVKESADKTVPPWAEKKAMLKESKDKTVPPWAEKKAMLKEAREIVENAGYTVISERYGDDDGDLLTAVLQKYVKTFDVLAMTKGLPTAKKIVIDDVNAHVGSGIGEDFATKFEVLLMKKPNLKSAAKYIADCWLKSMGQGVI